MLSPQLQSLILPSVLVVLALIGLGLLRSELRAPGIGLVRKKKRERVSEFPSGKGSGTKEFRKAG